MAEVTYLPEVRCDVTPGGIIPEGVTARLKDLDGRSQFVQVTRGMINHEEGQDYLPIGIVDIDRRGRRVLIELPVEADSGANRMWIGFEALRKEMAQGTEALA